MRLTSLIAVALLATAGSAPAANLIVNGGFETPDLSDGAFIQYFGGQSFAGWTATGADIGIIDTNYVESGIRFNAGAGNQALDITGAGNTSPANGLFQSIATEAGRTYRLSFLLGNADGSANPVYLAPSLIGVSIDGGAETVFSNAAVTLQGVNWAMQTMTFTATGASTVVSFRNATPVGDNYAGIDDVSVAAVPEPATWGLMLAGFGLVGCAMRRRTARTVLA